MPVSYYALNTVFCLVLFCFVFLLKCIFSCGTTHLSAQILYVHPSEHTHAQTSAVLTVSLLPPAFGSRGLQALLYSIVNAHT